MTSGNIESKFMQVLKDSLAKTSDIFSFKLCAQSQREGSLTIAVDFVPVFDDKSIADGVKDVFDNWYPKANRNLMIEFTIYDNMAYIRSICAPIGQSTAKRDIEYKPDVGFGKELRAFLLAVRREWVNKAAKNASEKKVGWAIDPFDRVNHDSRVIRTTPHAILVSSDVRDIRLEATAKPITGKDDKTGLEIKLSFKSVDKARIEHILTLIDQM
ncbi:hypothetical protein D3C79_191790 [compost metagenome]